VRPLSLQTFELQIISGKTLQCVVCLVFQDEVHLALPGVGAGRVMAEPGECIWGMLLHGALQWYSLTHISPGEQRGRPQGRGTKQVFERGESICLSLHGPNLMMMMMRIMLLCSLHTSYCSLHCLKIF
ncbi:hypothetical protein FQN60_015376, partial [Etheostoma spectabile]